MGAAPITNAFKQLQYDLENQLTDVSGSTRRIGMPFESNRLNRSEPNLVSP